MNTHKITRKRRGGGFFGPSEPKVPGQPQALDISNYIFPTTQISTQPNIDPSYKEIGIMHFTDSGSINALREFATNISNVFGKKGFDNVIYDKIRNQALMNLQSKIQHNQKVCNVNMEITNNMQDTIFIHIYGTLLQKN